MTVGQTDVQLVDDGVRRELRKSCCAALHDELERRRDEWTVTPSPISKGDREAEELLAGRFSICTPKLDAILDHLGDVPNVHVLILETRREARRWRGGPRLAGRIVEDRLRARGFESVQRASFLEGDEELEDKDEPRDAVVRRQVVLRVDAAVRGALAAASPRRVVVATTGGLPRANQLIEQVVSLHAAGATVDPIEVSDGSLAVPPTADRASPRRWAPEPALSYEALRHELELIGGGSLLAAWGAVQHLHADEVEERWTRVVKWLADFATSMPVGEDCDIALLRHRRTAVHAALRVELALRAGHIPRAIHGTVAFFEAALWDHLLQRVLERRGEPGKRRLFALDPEPTGDKLLRKGDDSTEDRSRPFECLEETAGRRWYAVFDYDACANRIAKRYLQRSPLLALGKAVSKVRDLRDDVAHDVPTPDLMQQAE